MKQLGQKELKSPHWHNDWISLTGCCGSISGNLTKWKPPSRSSIDSRPRLLTAAMSVSCVWQQPFLLIDCTIFPIRKSVPMVFKSVLLLFSCNVMTNHSSPLICEIIICCFRVFYYSCFVNAFQNSKNGVLFFIYPNKECSVSLVFPEGSSSWLGRVCRQFLVLDVQTRTHICRRSYIFLIECLHPNWMLGGCSVIARGRLTVGPRLCRPLSWWQLSR